MSFCYPLSLLHASQICRIGTFSSSCLEIGSKYNLNVVDGASWPFPPLSSAPMWSRVIIREPSQSFPSEVHSERFPLAMFAESCSVGLFIVAASLGGFICAVRRRFRACFSLHKPPRFALLNATAVAKGEGPITESADTPGCFSRMCTSRTHLRRCGITCSHKGHIWSTKIYQIKSLLLRLKQ